MEGKRTLKVYRQQFRCILMRTSVILACLIFLAVFVCSLLLIFDIRGKWVIRGSPLLPLGCCSVDVSYSQTQIKISHELHANTTETLHPRGEFLRERLNFSLSVSESNSPGKQCDMFSGRWVRDNSYPYYSAGSCPYVDESFDCFKNERPDSLFQKWRWQPSHCYIPRLNASDMLEKLRNKRLTFVGDSLNRNMWESLLCILREGLQNKSTMYEISGKKQFKTEGFYAFKFEEYNCRVEFIRAPFLVQEWKEVSATHNSSEIKETLRLDLMDSFASKYNSSDILVFNTGHWWSHEKTTKGQNYYQEGTHVHPQLNVLEAYQKALRTWAQWVDSNIDPKKTKVFFRGYSASHFSGGTWKLGGQCHGETEPVTDERHLGSYPEKMQILEAVLKQMKSPVTYLNVTRMSDYRKDGHPSVFRRRRKWLEGNSSEMSVREERNEDCSHWCLPGVPDAWNELLYASMLLM